MKLFGTSKIINGTLSIGSCNTVELTKKFGTPLYVMDEHLIRENCKMFKDLFKSINLNTEVIYASKAFLNVSMCKLIHEEGLSLDVVSGGELYTALKANFPSSKIYMHGNNKSKEELIFALTNDVGRIIVDNYTELKLIENICHDLNKKINILLRVNPGIEAHTHEYIQTSKNDSKFGQSILSEDIDNSISMAIKSKYLNLKGFHCHIGSQIFEANSFSLEVSVMFEFLNKINSKFNFITDELNLGGGFGVYYTAEDTPLNLKNTFENIFSIILKESKSLNLKLPKIMIEPGRSIVANAGTTLYHVGSTKTTINGKNYLFVNGGMTDNLRTALYDAKYEATLANKATDLNNIPYTIAGKCCESGDVIIKNILLPKANLGDILAVFSTGAYNYSMSSNYNRLPRPAVIFVKDGQPKLVVKRESYEDLIRNDIF